MKNILMDNPIIISDATTLLSECCGARAWNSLELVDTSLTGLCAECKEWSDFTEQDEFEDWADEVEYMKEHL